jgi:hypothetical protein
MPNMLVELHTFAGISSHPDFRYLNAFIHKEPHLARISFLLLIENMMLNQCFESSGKPEAIRQQWDGMLWFPEYGLVIPAVWELLIYMHWRKEHIRIGCPSRPGFT